MRLTFVCKDPDSQPGDCPSFYRTDEGSWIVQGWRRDDQAIAAQLRDLKDDETFVEIPDGLVRLFVNLYVEEAHGADHG